MRLARRRAGSGLIGLALAAAAWNACAQERGPEARALLLDLAGTLGEAHGLKQACRPDQQQWRDRMARLLEVERPEAALKARLTERFNAGYDAARTRHPRCTAKVFLEEGGAARRGRELSDRLARTP